jgi:hypothetical protein
MADLADAVWGGLSREAATAAPVLESGVEVEPVPIHSHSIAGVVYNTRNKLFLRDFVRIVQLYVRIMDDPRVFRPVLLQSHAPTHLAGRRPLLLYSRKNREFWATSKVRALKSK